jgi:hypothetical protein
MSEVIKEFHLPFQITDPSACCQMKHHLDRFGVVALFRFERIRELLAFLGKSFTDLMVSPDAVVVVAFLLSSMSSWIILNIFFTISATKVFAPGMQM